MDRMDPIYYQLRLYSGARTWCDDQVKVVWMVIAVTHCEEVTPSLTGRTHFGTGGGAAR